MAVMSRGKKTVVGVLGVVGAIIVGAVGSGVWQHLLGPVTGWLFRLALNVGTLGIEKFKDGVYAEIAVGDVQGASVAVLRYVGWFLGIAAGAALATAQEGLKLARQLGADGDERGEGAERERAERGPRLRLKSKARVLSVVLIVMVVVLSSAWTIDSSRVQYIAKAEAYIGQCERLLGPYVSDGQRLIWTSELARMRGRQEFVELQGQFERVARAQGVRLAEFRAW